jgi:hypothetical protein
VAEAIQTILRRENYPNPYEALKDLTRGNNKIDNIKKAIEHVQPYGIDLCSSVRTNGQLDESKLEELFKAIL